MIARSLTVLSGAMLLLAASSFTPLMAQEPPTAVPNSPPAAPDAQSQREEREAVEPAVSQPAVADPGEQPVMTREGAPIEETQTQDAADPTGAASPPDPAPTPPADQAAQPAVTTRFRTVDRLELESTAITGNRELPKVLYIVPWKKADLGDLVGRPANSLLDEVLTPVDRDVFKRQTDYFSKLDAAPAGSASGPEQKPAGEAPPR